MAYFSNFDSFVAAVDTMTVIVVYVTLMTGDTAAYRIPKEAAQQVMADLEVFQEQKSAIALWDRRKNSIVFYPFHSVRSISINFEASDQSGPSQP